MQEFRVREGTISFYLACCRTFLLGTSHLSLVIELSFFFSPFYIFNCPSNLWDVPIRCRFDLQSGGLARHGVGPTPTVPCVEVKIINMEPEMRIYGSSFRIWCEQEHGYVGLVRNA